jgi:hypothetical protein
VEKYLHIQMLIGSLIIADNFAIEQSKQSCNFKIRTIVSDISAKTARKMVYAISQGKTDIDYLLLQCHHSVRKRKGDNRLKAALGGLNESTPLQLQMLLENWEHAEAQRTKADNNIIELGANLRL